MFIEADYYPETNDETGLDHGYEWTPDYGGGRYLWKNWVYPHRPEGGWDCVEESSELRWSYYGGPTLPDPYEPTDLPEQPVVPPIVMTCALYINGVSQTLIDNVSVPILGTINAPLTIGPVP